jgi:hypothetical protein
MSLDPKIQLAILQTLGLGGLVVETTACQECLSMVDTAHVDDTGDTAEDDRRPGAQGASTERATTERATTAAPPTAAVLERDVLPEDVAAAISARLHAQDGD